jgi:hypothetical protein
MLPAPSAAAWLLFFEPLPISHCSREARKALGVHSGDKLLIVVRGNSVVILPKPRSWTNALRGLAKQPYPEDYLGQERDSWE